MSKTSCMLVLHTQRQQSYKVDSILCQPVEALDKQQQREDGNELRAEVFSEQGECQAGIDQCVPRAFHQMLLRQNRINNYKPARARVHKTHTSLKLTSISEALSCPKKIFRTNLYTGMTSRMACK